MVSDLIVHSFLDVVEDVGYNADSSTILKEIIEMYDAEIASTLLNKKTAKIPYTANIRRNKARDEFLKIKPTFKEIRKVTPKNQYQQKIKAIYRDLYIKVNRENRIKTLFRANRASNRAKYDRLCATAGKIYANMFIYAICLMSPVEYKQEVVSKFKFSFKKDNEIRNRQINND